ncbi:hypothetical protein [Polaromonas sp. JS666]|uniref:hypothetical protein n=1 Tax=Polaromonas sp. (strain JS666 / ATCC BAA-500) TaxID=296591 RepID=UPI0000463D6C|nr:hypothetical protein [Polaromonas sp. JS666]ABE45553.1 hypothetical protein Bpro_3649 [Polaromonas sp. JS666]
MDAIAILLLVAAFVLAGWKIFNRLPAVSYAGTAAGGVAGRSPESPAGRKPATAAAFT